MMLQVQIVEYNTGTAKKANYSWSVFAVIDVPGDNIKLAQGTVKGHQRAKGWKKLLKKVTNAAMKVPAKEPEQPDLPFTPDYAI